MSKDPRFWNKIAKKYARTPVPDTEVYERKIASIIELLNSDMRVLEFGCGTGTTAVRVAPHAGHIDATDFSSAMLDLARGRAKVSNVENIAFHETSVEDFSADAGSYDVVMMHSVLHLLKDPAAAVVKAHTLLKPGGWLVTSTTAIGDDGLWIFGWLARPGYAVGLLPRISVFTGAELRAMITGARFEIVEDWKPKKRAANFIVARKA
ncbi:MAG: class I SAM-dependent methyltransferase [Pseudomonadota bacterium]